MSTIQELILAEMNRDPGAGFDFTVLQASLKAANIQTSRTEVDNRIGAIRREQAELERQGRLAEFLAHYEKARRSDYPGVEAEFGLDGESGKPRMILWLEGKSQGHSMMDGIVLAEGKAAGV